MGGSCNCSAQTCNETKEKFMLYGEGLFYRKGLKYDKKKDSGDLPRINIEHI